MFDIDEKGVRPCGVGREVGVAPFSSRGNYANGLGRPGARSPETACKDERCASASPRTSDYARSPKTARNNECRANNVLRMSFVDG